jgi:hypothetical protein
VRPFRPALLAVLLLAALPATASATRVLYVGDSLGVGTTPYLRGLLPGTPIRADNRVGRPTPEALGVLARRLQPSDTVVVFDSGTNDDPRATGAYAARLGQARRLAGRRCLVLVTLNRPRIGRGTAAGMNAVVANVAYSDPNTQIADWAAVVNRSILSNDGIHATGRGYAIRARLVAQAIQECVATAAALKAEQAAPEPETPVTPAPSAPRRPKAKPKPKLPPWGPAVRRYWRPGVRDLVVFARTLMRESERLARRVSAATTG